MESGLRLSAALPSPQILRLRRELAGVGAGFGVSVARDGSVGGIHLRGGEDLTEIGAACGASRSLRSRHLAPPRVHMQRAYHSGRDRLRAVRHCQPGGIALLQRLRREPRRTGGRAGAPRRNGTVRGSGSFHGTRRKPRPRSRAGCRGRLLRACAPGDRAPRRGRGRVQRRCRDIAADESAKRTRRPKRAEFRHAGLARTHLSPRGSTSGLPRPARLQRASEARQTAAGRRRRGMRIPTRYARCLTRESE